MVDGDPAAVRSAVEAFLRQNVEGIGVISGHQGVTDAVLAMELTVPLIILRSTPHPGLMTVGADQYGAARTAVRHLIDLGHRTISHLAGPPDSADARERERGWRDELAAHDLAANVLGVGDWTPAAGYSLGARFDAEHFSAVFAANDQMALGLMHALAGKGLVVPDDVSIVGFDDIPESAHFSPPLTTLRQDFRRLGHDMLTMLLARIDGSEPEPIEVQQPQLIVRSSTREPSRVDLSTRS
jgi:DNA-binding LacI/PurR family transcriptional regulator